MQFMLISLNGHSHCAQASRAETMSLNVVLMCAGLTFTCANPQARGVDLRARRAALQVLDSVQHGAALEDALCGRNVSSLSPRARAFVRKLTLQTVRHINQLDVILDVGGELPTSTTLRDVLRLGAAQLLLLRVPEYAAVSTSVSLAASIGMPSFKGLVNKRLRSVSEAREEHAARLEDTSIALPPWLAAAIEPIASPAELAAIGQAMLATPPLDLSIRVPIGSTQEGAAWASKLGGVLMGYGTVRLPSNFRGALTALPGYADGQWWVQDFGATAAVQSLAAGNQLGGVRVCDLCAAPGGKTLQLLAQGASVTAVDRSGARIERLRENLRRCLWGLEQVDVVHEDAIAWARAQAKAGNHFDAVLLDAPCSGTGLVRRHPASVLRPRRSVNMRRLVRSQRELLRAACDLVRPGGMVVYSTCSLLPAEGEDQIEAFLSELVGMPSAPRIRRWPVLPSHVPDELSTAVNARGELRLLPSLCASQGFVDGHFVCVLKKS